MSSADFRLVDIKPIDGKIELKSGLHIGAGDTEMQIGGTDNPVIKHPHTLEPFIPGSSLKGKVRALLELRSGLLPVTEGRPVNVELLETLDGKKREECEKILKIFGVSGAEAEKVKENRIGPTRASFADCFLTDECRRRVRQERLGFFEVKSENSINRIRGTAENPRFTERVPAGMTFEFSVNLKILNEDGDGLLDYLLEGLKLLQMDSLGGSGSRGYGKIGFTFKDAVISEKFDRSDPFNKRGE